VAAAAAAPPAAAAAPPPPPPPPPPLLPPPDSFQFPLVIHTVTRSLGGSWPKTVRLLRDPN
jgi:hypothetical protein